MHIRFLLVRAKNITQWKIGLSQFPQTFFTNPLELTYYYTMQNSCCDHSNVCSGNQPSACEQALLFIWTLTWRMTSETWRILKIFFGVSSLTPAAYPKIFDRRPRKGVNWPVEPTLTLESAFKIRRFCREVSLPCLQFVGYCCGQHPVPHWEVGNWEFMIHIM